MQRTSRTAAGRHREILLAMFNRPFLIRTGYKMLELIGMGNNPMVGATVACAVAVEEANK